MSDSDFMVSEWHNPTDQEVKFKIHLGGRTREGKRNEKRFVVPPGKSVMVSSEWDQAIRKVNKEGYVVGGLAPQLIKKGEEDVPVHVALIEAALEGDKERAIKAAGRLAGKPVEQIAKAMGDMARAQPGSAAALLRAQVEAEEREIHELKQRQKKNAEERARLEAEMAGKGADIGAKLDAAGIGTQVKTAKGGKGSADN